MPFALHPLLPPALAGLVALGMVLAGRWRDGWRRVALAAGLLAGAAVLTPFNLRAFWAPRVMADHLLLVAAAGLVAVWLQGRAGRRWVVPLAFAMATGWWVAHAPPAAAEFWRAGFVVTVYVLLLARAGAPALCAAGLAGAAAFWAAGAAPVWQGAMLIAAAAAMVAGLGRAEGALAGAGFVAAAAALASLAGGRAVVGRVTALDVAALAPLLVGWGWPVVARRLPALPGLPGLAVGRGRPKARVAVRRRRA